MGVGPAQPRRRNGTRSDGRARVAPGTGAINFAIRQGTAITNITNRVATAQAQTADLGLIGLAATSEDCKGETSFQPSDLPQPTTVDNRNGDAKKSATERGNPFGAGEMFAEATTQPLAHATATTQGTEFGPLVTVGSGQADTVSQTTAKGSEATGTVDADITIAGLLRMEDLHWEVLHRTGAKSVSEGSFSAGKITQAGVAVPLPTEGQAAEDAINAALLTSGVSVIMPKVERLTDPADLVRVTPMTIILKDSPAGKTLIGPGLNLTRTQREQLFDSIVAQYCKAASYLLVGDITVSVVSGTGFMAVEIGGAMATSGTAVFSNPFDIGPAAPPLPLPPSDPVLSPGSVTPPQAIGGTGGVTSPPAATPTAPVADTSTLEEFCESVHPFAWPSCSHGAAAPLGILGLLATSGMAFLDWRHQRRGPRMAPDPIWNERKRGVLA